MDYLAGSGSFYICPNEGGCYRAVIELTRHNYVKITFQRIFSPVKLVNSSTKAKFKLLKLYKEMVLKFKTSS